MFIEPRLLLWRSIGIDNASVVTMFGYCFTFILKTISRYLNPQIKKPRPSKIEA